MALAHRTGQRPGTLGRLGHLSIFCGGPCRVRTCDLVHVKDVLYRCANGPKIGASGENRTHDLSLTKGVLYH